MQYSSSHVCYFLKYSYSSVYFCSDKGEALSPVQLHCIQMRGGGGGGGGEGVWHPAERYRVVTPLVLLQASRGKMFNSYLLIMCKISLLLWIKKTLVRISGSPRVVPQDQWVSFAMKRMIRIYQHCSMSGSARHCICNVLVLSVKTSSRQNKLTK